MIDEDLPRWLLLLGVAIVTLPLLMMSMMMLMMGAMGGPPMMGPGGGDPGAFRFIGFVPLTLVVVLLYAGSRLLRTDDGDEPTGTTSDPVERLRERYVAGELTEDEFERELERRIDASDADVDVTATDRQREFER